jgi:hypothetical protein
MFRVLHAVYDMNVFFAQGLARYWRCWAMGLAILDRKYISVDTTLLLNCELRDVELDVDVWAEFQGNLNACSPTTGADADTVRKVQYSPVICLHIGALAST